MADIIGPEWHAATADRETWQGGEAFFFGALLWRGGDRGGSAARHIVALVDPLVQHS